jgi:hypothetical protein
MTGISSYEGPFEYQPLPQSTVYGEWDNLLQNFQRRNFSEHCVLAGRLYGDERSGYRPYVLIFVSPGSRFGSMDMTDLCQSFEPLVITTTRPMLQMDEKPNATLELIGPIEPVNPQFSQIIQHGSSIGRCGTIGSSNFGGYVEIEKSTYGMSVCHGTCLAKCPSITFHGERGSKIESNSGLDRDYIIIRAKNDIKRFMMERESVEGDSDKDECEENLNRAVAIAHYNESLTVSERDLGEVVCCSGATEDGLDWSVFSMEKSRIGKNEFPVVDQFVAKYPESLAKPRASTTSARQDVVYISRTSGLSRGIVRALRVCELRKCGNADLVSKRLYWSVFVTSSERLGMPGGKPGDSGSWVFERRSGKPLLMVVGGCSNIEVLCISLIEVFNDVKRATGMDIKLPSYSRVARYGPKDDDDDIGLVEPARVVLDEKSAVGKQ